MREFPALFSSEICLDAIPRNTRKPDRSGQRPEQSVGVGAVCRDLSASDLPDCDCSRLAGCGRTRSDSASFDGGRDGDSTLGTIVTFGSVSSLASASHTQCDH